MGSRRATRGTRGRGRRFGLYLLAVLALLGVMAYFLRSILLAGLAGPLVVSDPVDGADHVLIVDGDRRYEEAARLYGDNPEADILVIVGPPPRPVRAGLLPGAGELTRRELARRGAAQAAVVEIAARRGHQANDWTRAAALDGWLRANAGGTVVVLCDAFSSRYLRFVYDRVLADQANRLRWRALRHRDYDIANWWRTEPGMLDFFAGYAGLVHAWLMGDGGITGEDWDPTAWLRERAGVEVPDPAPPEPADSAAAEESR